MIKGKKKTLYLQMGIVALIALSIIWRIGDLNYIAVLNDEFGYWGTAASVVGYNWQDLVKETPYYSFGYSVFLIPIMMIFENSILMYHAAIILNIIFLCVSYFLAFFVAKMLFSQTKPCLCAGICGAVILYTSNTYYAQIAWSESLLYFLMWAFTAIIVACEKNFSYYKIFTASVILGFMYTVHQRTIGIVAIGVFAIIFLIIANKKRIRGVLIPIFVIAGILFIQIIMKNLQLESIWNNSEASNVNNVGINIQTIGGIFYKIIYNIKNLVKSIGGKVYYVLIASGFTITIGFWVTVCKCAKQFRKKISYTSESIIVTYFFILIAFIAMLGICAIQTLDAASRKDIIVYSRYMENAMGPLLLISLLEVVNNFRKSFSKIIISFIIVIPGTWFVFRNLRDAEGIFNTPCSPVFGAFFVNSQKDAQQALYYLIISIILISLFWILLLVLNKKDSLRNILLIVVLILGWQFTAYEASRYLMDYRAELDIEIVPIKKYIMENNASNIYYLKAEEIDLFSINPKYLQFMIPNHSIQVIENVDSFNEEKEGILLVNPKTEVHIDIDELVIETEMLKVYRKRY